MPRTIYVDVDDVLADATECLRRLATQLFGRTPSGDESVFDLRISFSLSDDEHAELMHAVHEREVILTMTPDLAARDVLRGWRQQGGHIAIVTGRHPGARESTAEWLRMHQMPFDSLDIVDKYGRHGEAPGSLCLDDLEERQFDLAVEDSLSMAAFLASGRCSRVLLRDQPWNRDLSGLDEAVARRMTRVRSWSEIAAGWAAVAAL